MIVTIAAGILLALVVLRMIRLLPYVALILVVLYVIGTAHSETITKCARFDSANKCVQVQTTSVLESQQQSLIVEYPDPSPVDCRKSEAMQAWIVKGEDPKRLRRLMILCKQVPLNAMSVLDVLEHNPLPIIVTNVWWSSVMSLVQQGLSRDEAAIRLQIYIEDELNSRGEDELMPDFGKLNQFVDNRERKQRK